MPFFANLQPEGHLRKYLVQRAGVNPEREFHLLWALGQDLLSAISVTPADGGAWLPVHNDTPNVAPRGNTLLFSLAGVWLKFQAAMSVTECVLLGRREQLGWRITRKDRQYFAHALSRMQLSHLADARMDQLSGGQQQRVLLAQRISRGPRMLVLDEPTSALDLRHQLDVLSLLRELSHEMLIVTALHNLTLAGRFADHLVLIDQGQARGVGTPHHILQHEGLGDCNGIKVEIPRDSQGSLVFVTH